VGNDIRSKESPILQVSSSPDPIRVLREESGLPPSADFIPGEGPAAWLDASNSARALLKLGSLTFSAG
jgi:hypothetical protein